MTAFGPEWALGEILLFWALLAAVTLHILVGTYVAVTEGLVAAICHLIGFGGPREDADE